MILKTRWYDLDDGDDGIPVDRVDWNGCSEDTKKRLIDAGIKESHIIGINTKEYDD